MSRRRITVRGIVQGVGFRPFVYLLAGEKHLVGFVRNQSGEVLIEVEGDVASLDAFLADLTRRAPPLAHIEEVFWEECSPQGESTFLVQPSETHMHGPIRIGPDVATCEECLSELFDAKDRRYRYPFLNCTNCGPRLTIIRSAPYDRERTTMASFAMCEACQAEYDDPSNRRFHAQPIACPTCGPWLEVLGGPEDKQPLTQTVAALRDGKIVAVKGLGGYHLACDARHEDVVRRLRQRKHRDEKPFAVMVANLDAARQWCTVSEEEAALLVSPRRPIVVLRKQPRCPIADAVAPGNAFLGLMLPYTPLHHLLLHDLGDMPVVMTSGNRSDEPIAYKDDQARETLSDIADLFLVHNRPIHLRCDDSVTRVVAGQELPLRRSRGYAPQPITLPIRCTRPTLAVGGQLKNVFALAQDHQALLSHHLGDLDHYEAFRAFTEAVTHYEQLFEIHQQLIVHDLHPDYASTRYALERLDVELLGVQHHHAHMASCMAEHGLTEPVIGISFDGTGYGLDGAIWGGEFLIGDYHSFHRAGHLRYVGMPGGEQAIREPWRMALAWLHQIGRESHWNSPENESLPRRGVLQLLNKGLNCPPTSSVGRLFDAIAALIGLRRRVSYEGQAAVELEALAQDETEAGTYPFTIEGKEAYDPQKTFVVHPGPMIAAIMDEVKQRAPTKQIAGRFHSTVVEMIREGCDLIRTHTGVNAVTLSGGVFLNALLTAETEKRLKAIGFRVYRHRLVPPNDGGLCLGQLAIAAVQRGESDVSGSAGKGRGNLPRT